MEVSGRGVELEQPPVGRLGLLAAAEQRQQVAERHKLQQIISQLVGNAVKFTSPGGSVTVGATQRGDAILVSVKDTGAGIAPDQLPHIFDRFWQAKKAHRRGTGLGLTICRHIATAHQADFAVNARPGGGTVFTLNFPAAG